MIKFKQLRGGIFISYQGGGRTDKAGNKYETNYIIFKMLEVIEEEIYSVTIEPIGDDEKGIDLWIVNNDETREGQQCKGRNQNEDKWSISSLKKHNIFKKWKFQLDRDNNNRVSIVSPLSFTLLEDLINLARTSSNEAIDFYENQILNANKEMKDFYMSYCREMNLDIKKENELIKSLNYLRRTEYRQTPDFFLKEINIKKMKYLFCDDEEIVYNALLDYVINGEIWGKEIDIITIKKYLLGKGIRTRNLADDKRIFPCIQRLNEEFECFFNPINNEMIFREECTKCEEIIERGESIIISGKAGYGKSGVIQLVVQDCKRKGIPYFAIKLDKRVPRSNTKEWGKKLGLPASISYCLDSISKDRNAVIILDQLDALRWTHLNSTDAVLTCKQLIEEVEEINKKRKKKISIILVCRIYDLKYDNNIKLILKNEKIGGVIEEDIDEKIKWNKIEIDKFSEEVVEKIVGKQYRNNSKKLNELLKIPSNLYIWCHLDKSKIYDNCFTTNRLIQEWWEQVQKNSINANIDSELIKICIDEIVKKMFRMSKTSIMNKFLNVDEKALNYLVSSGFLLIENKIISFTHQRIYDYFIEVEMINMYQDNKSIDIIIGDIEQQTPSRRYQTQMFLEDLNEIGTEDFIRAGKDILASNNIRFYIKHVFFEVLGQIEHIDSEIEDFILDFCKDETYSKYIINNVIQYNIQYVKILLDNGILDEWIEDETRIDACILILESVKYHYDNKIVQFIERQIFKNKEIDKKLFRCIGFYVDKETDEVFELRMKIYERYPELSEAYIDFKSLFKANEMRAIKLIKFWLEHNISGKNKGLYKYEDELIDNESAVIIKKDEEILDILLPCVPINTDVCWGEWTGRNKSESIERVAINIIKKANNNLVKNNPEKFWDKYKKYIGKGYPLYNELILEGLEKLPNEYSDEIISCLCEDFEKSILDTTSGNGDKLIKIKKVIAKHSKTCNVENFEKLEKAIYYFKQGNSVEEYKNVRKYKLNYICRRMPWDWWGNIQVELLPCLCKDRTSDKTKNLIKVLQRRFNNGSNYFHYSNGHAGNVWSPISGKKISDKQWAKILSNGKLKQRKRLGIKQVEGGFIESTIEEFSASFSSVVAEEPNRMINLVINNKNTIIEDYVDALYMGLQMSNKLNEVSNEKIEKVFSEFPCDNVSYRASNICRIIEKKKDANWSKYTLNMVKDIAINHKNSKLYKQNSARENDIDNLSIDSLNYIREMASNVIAYLISVKRELLEQFKGTIIDMVNDENMAVRFLSLNCLYAAYWIEKEWAMPIIIKMFEQDERYLEFRESRSLLFDMYKTDKERVLRIIRRLYFSENEKLKQIGILAVAEMYIYNNEFIDILTDVKNISIIHQDQINKIIGAYFNRPEYNQRCKELIMKLDYNNCDLKSFVKQVFYDGDINIEKDKEFLEKIVKNNPSCEYIFALNRCLEKGQVSIVDFSGIILTILNYFVNHEDNNTKKRMYGGELSKLVVALYDAVEGKKEKQMKNIEKECLDIFDKMYEIQIDSIVTLSKEILDI